MIIKHACGTAWWYWLGFRDSCTILLDSLACCTQIKMSGVTDVDRSPLRITGQLGSARREPFFVEDDFGLALEHFYVPGMMSLLWNAVSFFLPFPWSISLPDSSSTFFLF